MIRFLAAVAVLAATAGAPAGAAAPLSLTVTPLVVEFHAAPGDSGSAQIFVANTGAEPERVVVQPIDWRTTLDGSLRLERPGAEGRSSLTDRLRISASDVVLRPGESRALTLSAQLPSTLSHESAVYWGGYYVRAVPLGGGSVAFGPAAAVVVYDTVGAPRKHVAMTKLAVTAGRKGSAVATMRMQNDGVAYVRPTVRTVVATAGHVVQDQTDNNAVVFAGNARTFTKELTGLQPGRYQLEMTIDYGGSTLIEGSTVFSVP